MRREIVMSVSGGRFAGRTVGARHRLSAMSINPAIAANAKPGAARDPARAAHHPHGRRRQRRHRRQRGRPRCRHGARPRACVLVDRVPQGHKVALAPIGAGDAVRPLRHPDRLRRRSDRRRPLGARAAAEDAGGALARGPAGRDDQAGAAPRRSPATPSRASATPTARSARATSSPSRRRCSASPASSSTRSARIKAELLPRYPNVDDVVGLEHGYGCGVAIDAPDAQIPIRTLRNISKNPNFGGEIMVVSLGCEKLQPERLLPPGSFAIRDERGEAERPRRSTSSACRTRRTSASPR